MSDKNIRSPYLDEQYADNRIYRDLLKGLKSIRGSYIGANTDKQSIYLPKFESEPEHIYKQRLSRSYLTNYYLRTIQSDSGKVLANPIKIESDGADMYSTRYEWLDDMDFEGKSVEVFAKDQLQAGQAKGLTLAFVDYIDAESRPFVREIDVDDILAFKTDQRTGRLVMLRWQSSVITDSEEELTDNKNVIFEITPTEWRMYSDDDLDTPEDQGEIVRFRNGTDRINNELPVSLFYTNKTGVLKARSPYQGLAELTIEHFQVSSDIKNMMFYALQPILFGRGMPDDFKMTALASYVAAFIKEGSADASNVDMKWVQVDAGPIEQAREQVADIESRISAFGIDANGIRPSGVQTATQASIDSAGSSAALRMFASGLEEHVERVLEIMSSYTLEPLEVDVTITPDFSVADNDKHATAAKNAFDSGVISGKAYTDVLINTGTLDKDFDYETDQELARQDRETSGLGSML